MSGDVAARAEEVRRQLDYHNHRYYVLDDPEVGDDVYDALLDELRRIEAEHPELVRPDSPTQRVGAEPVSKLTKVRHPQPMYSLANVRSADELRAWIARMRGHLAREGIEDPAFAFVAEPKIDAVEVARLGKRIYRDQLSLEVEEGGRRRYRIYGDAPEYHREEGTDLAAIAAGRIAVTPLHFDLTDQPGLETLGAYDLARLLAPAARDVE